MPASNFVKRNYAFRNSCQDASSSPPSLNRIGEIGLQLFERFALGKTPRKSRDLSPESALFRFVDDGFQFHSSRIPTPEAIRNMKFRAVRGSNSSTPRDFQDA
jgi:hypothetical protein